ncbi:D-aminoacyl-tRNA deacylase [Halorubrum sodomense]|uniref:D-aminoacyl-tRNA deacylase n=1 Tax=Halorubrum sodomense TaxID=35743 RepID=A0A1I6GBR0_HALSD|nr:D-aminoacyl-tRNA deacylase [Halorubrum sodomense]SFR39608.1 D-aminoacyl-tRNA deacylase [Halorubrum sodomense]
MIAIVVSRADSASAHIGERLLEVEDWEAREDDSRPDADGGGTYYRTDGFELREFDDLHIRLSDPTAAFDCDPAFLAFVSRHSGETGKLLTAHATGNFGGAEHGGDPESLALAAPGAEKRVVEALARHAPDGYEVGIECTHHGPTDVSVPSLFVELGSDEPQWADSEAARAVARAVLDLRGTGADLADDAESRPRHVVGFGGGHYAPRFTRIVRETEWAVGHVGADWTLADLGAPDANRAVIDAAFARSRAERAVIDGDRPDLGAVVEDLGYRVVSETWVREVGDAPLPLVEGLEAAVGPVDEGLRFGAVVDEAAAAVETAEVDDRDASDDQDASDDVGDAVRVRDLPADLLARAQGLDAEGAREAVESVAVAFDTEQGGTRAAGRVAFATTSGAPGYADLVEGLAAVLETAYDAVEVAPEVSAVVARETAFDPSLAAERGVPEGPAFGRLADGESVDVDGETVEPEAVSRARTERFPIDGGAFD